MESYLSKVPIEVLSVALKLHKAGFETFFVGGCVRDVLLHKKPKDWDITTNATPEEIIALFPKTFYENKYGTVSVVNDPTSQDATRGTIDETLKIVEITPYRLESAYSDNRRPDSVIFSDKLEDDLKRRDFTVNALAFDPNKDEIVDKNNGLTDLKDKILRTVGNPKERFSEDALRLLRAVRFSAELDFEIEPETEKAIAENSHLLKNISKERIRDEFTKIILSSEPKRGLELVKKFHMLEFISSDLEASVGIEQGGIHKYDVWEHLLRALQYTADKNLGLEVRLAALFHDIGKPNSRRSAAASAKKEWTFYGHEVVSAKIAKKTLENLKFSKEITEKVVKLVRWHMFFSDTETITHSAVRRLIVNVGKENIWDLMDVRAADRIGTGRPKESPYRLRKFHAMIEEVMRDPISVGMLKIDGKGIMEATKTNPGKHIGYILHALLEEVIESPEKNTLEYLQNRAIELNKLPEKELEKLGEQGKTIKEEEDEKLVGEIRKKHWVN